MGLFGQKSMGGIEKGPSKSDQPGNPARRDFLRVAGAAAAAAALGELNFDRASQAMHEMQHHGVTGREPEAIERIKAAFAEVDQQCDPERWARAIDQAFADAGLEKTDEHLAEVLTLIAHESGFRAVPRSYDYVPTPDENTVAAMTLIKPRTGGPMELSFDSVMREEGISYKEAVARVSTVEGGVRYGVQHLKRIIDTYASLADESLKRLCVFADYNAGPYASRNAAIQHALNRLDGAGLREDGLIFKETRRALSDFFEKQGRRVNETTIEEDLKHLLSERLESTETWRVLVELSGGTLLPVPADRPVLGPIGFAKKALTGINNSREYAHARAEEYQQVFAILASLPASADAVGQSTAGKMTS